MGLAASKHEAFWEACGFGHKDKVKNFIEQGINVNWVSYTHNSCAIHVASQGKPEIVQMLIDAKCEINAKDDRGNLALHHAAMKGHAKIMQMLMDAGSQIDVQDKNGWTPLINAAYFCQPDAVEVLISNKCDVNLQNKDERTALHEACRSQSEDNIGLAIIVCHLIEAGCDINAKSSDVGEADFTPLMFAAYHGHPDVAEALIEAQCDINAQGTNGWSALHWATDMGHKDVVRVLLRWGIDPLLEGRRGELALDRAKDSEIKDEIREVTVKAQRERDEEDGFVCHSPVSTTSPLSSRSSSVSSLTHDDDNIEDNDLDDDNENCETPIVMDNDLAAVLLEQEQRQNISRKSSNSTGDSNNKSSPPTGMSSSSGTISEKDEKETLEKEMICDAAASSCAESFQSEEAAMEGSKDKMHSCKEEFQGCKEEINSCATVDMELEKELSVSEPDSVPQILQAKDNNAACTTADGNAACSQQLNKDNSDTSRSTVNDKIVHSKITDTGGSSPIHEITMSTNNLDLAKQSQSDKSDANNCDNDVNESLAGALHNESETSDSKPSTPLKLNPQIQRLVHPSTGLSDTDDGNVSDAIIGDGGYSDDLLDSDLE